MSRRTRNWLPDLINKEVSGQSCNPSVDPLGYFIAPWAYAELEVLGQAVAATKSLDDAKLANYIHNTEFKTLVGDVKFGLDGEWSQARILIVQFQNVRGNGGDPGAVTIQIR